MKAVIGISTNFDRQSSLYTLKDFYIQAFCNLPAIPVLLPAVETEAVEDWLHICQGLIFSGGGDIDPHYWGEYPQINLGNIEPCRDHFEIALAQASLHHQIPVLGICRGCQVMNVAAGGSIWQHLESDLEHQQKAPYAYGYHQVDIKDGCRLHSITEKSNMRVNSFHHQAVHRLGEGLSSTAWAEDGTVEAIEHEYHPFWIGVQWHPECMTDACSFRLFQSLVQAALTVNK